MNTDGPLRDKSELITEIYFKIAVALFYLPGFALMGEAFSLWTAPILLCWILIGIGGAMIVGAFFFMLWAANH